MILLKSIGTTLRWIGLWFVICVLFGQFVDGLEYLDLCATFASFCIGFCLSEVIVQLAFWIRGKSHADTENT